MKTAYGYVQSAICIKCIQPQWSHLNCFCCFGGFSTNMVEISHAQGQMKAFSYSQILTFHFFGWHGRF